jgi:hypothetical protein
MLAMDIMLSLLILLDEIQHTETGKREWNPPYVYIMSTSSSSKVSKYNGSLRT